MIESIALKNFKSFLDTGILQFAPITLISGQNSSGKSSILQSILLLKQTLESPVSDEPILINGSYVSLGEFADIVNNHSHENDTVDFEINFTSNKNNLLKDERYYYLDLIREKFNEIGLKIEILPTKKDDFNSSNVPILSGVNFKNIKDGKSNYDMTFQYDENLKNNLAEQFDLKNKFFGDEELLLKPIKLRKSNVEAVLFNTFLPESVLVPHNEQLEDEQETTMQFIINTIIDNLGLNKRYLDTEKLTPFINYLNRVKTTHRVQLLDKNGKEEDVNVLFKNFEEIFVDQPEFKNVDVIKTLEFYLVRLDLMAFEILTEYINNQLELVRKLKNNKKTLVQKMSRFNENDKIEIYDLQYFIRNTFNKIQYLGPLREEPRQFYGKFGSQNPLYVGQKGENVAFVLKYYSNRKIKAIIPPSKNEDFKPSVSDIQTVNLGYAVQKWLEYLGIAKEIKVDKMGKVGLTLQANIHGDIDADLTNVGVGVSQVLPLVVLGLSASSSESVILLEQPELHLHPYVQSRLADFFISLNMLGKQIIAETHSEHLVNRLRYHIAKGNISYNKDAAIYFCSREEGMLESEVRKVDIDKFGAVDFYPNGFFDETEKQLESILMAAIERGIE
ncbi:AAA family ATPase [Peribacillus frigoritolerans]|uniref:AAA family ATPase n=1 Tax=Peribacillus frigoritolerans TaxID=450367 RepID=UPI00105A8CA2|nr:DUF3696 domain-containing protein [Peribacillus frigoritolerans]TDL76106.1 DUF3696 domain-containing protein [Peribacillus frigoritolerans]